MKLLGWILLAMLTIAAAQAVAVVLVLLALVYGLCIAPRETFGLIALAIVLNVATAHPAAALGIVFALVIRAWLVREKVLDEPATYFDSRGTGKGFQPTPPDT